MCPSPSARWGQSERGQFTQTASKLSPFRLSPLGAPTLYYSPPADKTVAFKGTSVARKARKPERGQFTQTVSKLSPFRLKTTAVFFPFDLFGSSGASGGADLLADEFEEI